MSKKIAQLIDKAPLSTTEVGTDILYPVHVGVEIEAENVRDYDPWMAHQDLWRLTRDGSLRNNGVEAVFARPLSPLEAEKALRVAAELGKGYDYSDRTSVHVHVNVRDISSPALFRFILLYAIFEKLLYAKFGPERYANNFCVPAATNYDLLTFLGALDRRRVVAGILLQQTDDRRYGGINLACLARFGTVEFRMCRGTCDYDTLVLLINALLAMREYAVRHRDPSTYVRDVSDTGAIGLFHAVFPKKVADALSEGMNLYDLCMDGARVVDYVLHYREMVEASDELRARLIEELTTQAPKLRRRETFTAGDIF